MNSVRIIPTLLAILLMSTALAQGVGDVAPDFALLAASGDVVRLSDYRGTPVVLNVWATWCPFCIEELPIFQRASDDLNPVGMVDGLDRDEADAIILLVNLAEPFELARDFLVEVGISLPAVFDGTPDMRRQAGVELDDTSSLLTRRYRVRGMPTTFFIDAGGVLRFVKVGPLSSDNEFAEHLARIGVRWQP